MAILITGGSGFIGSALTKELMERGHKIYSLSRHPQIGSRRLVPVFGDITKENLGLESVPRDITIVYHLAGIHTLRQKDKDGSLWRTNVEGTRNVLYFCLRHDIPRLYFVSTAYTWPVNPYGMSKIQNEKDITAFAEKHGLKVTIFKPSVVMGNAEHPYPGHFSQFASVIIRVHRRAELIRRKLEGNLHLPVIEPLFRIRGNPRGKLNLIQLDQVVWGMTNIEETGTFWLTHPDPRTIQQLCNEIGKVALLRIIVSEERFKAQPIEAIFQKVAAPFAPYLQGDSFPSDLQLSPPITKELIHDTIKRAVLD